MSTIPTKRSAPTDIQEQIAQARQRAAEAKVRIESRRAAGGPPPSTSSAPQDGASSASRLAALKARVAAATAKTAPSPAQPPPPAPSSAYSQPVEFDDLARAGNARGGLAVGLHPALLGDLPDTRGKAAQKPKPKNKQAEQTKSNPYISDEKAPPSRPYRQLHFTHNMHARPAMAAANEARRKAALEAMKKRIQAQAARAGLDESAEIQALAVPAPPDVEFWDEALQTGIEGNEMISRLVVHPILIEPPQAKFTDVGPQPLKLTKREQKKQRRIRRAEEHKEEQAKIRLGLVPTPAPKIKHSNVMRVYGEMAVKDPTAVEAMVNKQVAERKNAHDQSNVERQLSKEERAQKLQQKADENAARGLQICVFKVALGKEKLLGKHRYLIDKNAKEWHDVTGCVIVAPSMTIVLLEGGEHSTRQYTKLMLRRIKWQAILEGNGQVQQGDDTEHEKGKGKTEDTEDNTCTLIYQGLIRDRKFKKWGSIREVESDSQAKDALTKAKMENFWTLAKSTH
ncbi:PRP3-domain-containing protein [Trichodelitschia bisporula]|uniref:PRP3-domain-containing protein n=1 Tax=Trichodelitschia bisporula TaxID=703511 RepID=A0A6G1IAC9_9PEZI|nr:PRP3-domain-containing protein [Trichodelitschia bisporula]